MQSNYLYPVVYPWKKGAGELQVSAAIHLKSLESVKLFDDRNTAVGEEYPSPQHLHGQILRDLACWSECFSIDLNIYTNPIPAFTMGGKIELVIVVTAVGSQVQKPQLMAQILSRVQTLFQLLTSYQPKAEFEYVTDLDELRKMLRPFTPSVVFQLDRQRQNYRLSKQQTCGVTRPLGFLYPTSITAKEQSGKAEQVITIPYLFPWCQDNQLDLSRVCEALLAHPSPLWYQVRIRPTVAGRDETEALEQQLFYCEELLANQQKSNHHDLLLTTQANTLRKALAERLEHLNRPLSLFKGGVFLCATSPLDNAIVAAVANEISCPPVITVEPQLAFKGGITMTQLPVRKFLTSDCLSADSFTVEEMACAFRIPQGRRQDPHGLPIRNFRTSLIASHLVGKQGGELLLGRNRHRGLPNEVWLTAEDRMRHMAVMGQTGTGKSVFLESLVLQDILQGRGCCFIDPHGDSVEKLLRLYPFKRAKDLVLIDFQEPDQILPFNILLYQNVEERDRLIDELYAWIDLQYDMRIAGGPMFELYFRTLMALLLPEEPRQDFVPVMGDFSALFVDEEFRKYCLEQCPAAEIRQQVKSFVKMGGETSFINMGPYITSKLTRFLSNKTIKLMTAQEGMALDFDSFMDKGKVVLINLGRGKFGEVTTSFLASQIVIRIQSAAMRRISRCHEDRKDFCLYIDEFQNVASESFITLLSEARKFRLGLVLANQYASQLDRSNNPLTRDSVLNAILGNVGAIVCFRLGVKDAEVMEGVFRPTFMAPDLINLPLGTCYANLKARGKNPCSFSMETIPIPELDMVKNREAFADVRRSAMPAGAKSYRAAEQEMNARISTISCLY